ncbi:MAG: glycogen synthase [Spirochaetales bacterium]|nr:glycogen synthase [Spirochaetales bacterium]
MRILMVSSESVPFSKTGGLADVVGALSNALVKSGHDARILVPSFGKEGDEAGTFVCTLTMNLIGGQREVEIRRRTVDGVIYWFVCDPLFTKRSGVYGNTSFTPYPDNFLRFLILQKAALLVCRVTGWIPDVMHCHDWTTGLVPYLLEEDRSGQFNRVSTLVTIHNIAFQGNFPRYELLNSMTLPRPEVFTPDGRINMLRAGIIMADYVSTVSPNYAKEIRTAEQGFGLEGVLNEKADRLSGILNGIDAEVWNPATDRHLPFHYSSTDRAPKAQVKAAVQKRFGLEVRPDLPLFSMVTRLAWQKGIEEVLSVLEDILKEGNCQFLIIGTGDARYEQALRDLDARYPNLSANMVFSDEAAHLAEAGADYFLMPSRYEPCGLNQLYSLRYGAVPIVGRTGGLADSVIDLEQDPVRGTGLFVRAPEAGQVRVAVAKAVSLYGTKQYDRAQENGMKQDCSWAGSAHEYIALYEKMIKEKKKNTSKRRSLNAKTR